MLLRRVLPKLKQVVLRWLLVGKCGYRPRSPVKSPDVGSRALNFGHLCLNLEALHTGKGPPSCSGDTYRPLKQMKYIAIDE